MLACIVIALFAGPDSKNSGAETLNASRTTTVPSRRLTATAPEHCSSARKAVSHYRRITWERQLWRESKHGTLSPLAKGKSCHWVRYAAGVWAARAHAAKKALRRWYSYHYDWQKWMPDKLQRVGACETGYGQRPGNFHWDSGTYVSFAGIIRGGYAEFAHALGLRSWDETRRELGRDPTPREQVLVTLALQARYSWSAWGCGGA